MSVVLSNSSETPRISVLVSSQRSGYVTKFPLRLLEAAKDQRLIFNQLGTFGRAKAKVDELQGVIAESRRAGH